ncbi:RM24, ribosomal protein 24 mitochondrial large ribosomal subunit, partial [Protomyces lactucae-debilis]
YARQDRGLYGGTHIQYGNNVPDSKTKTRRRWLPNVHRHSLRSDILNKHISLRIQTGVLRTIKKYGSLDAFL